MGNKEKRKSDYNKEYISYIYSEEFISKFGDWENANRLERLKAAKTLIGNERIIVQGNDITDLVDRLRRQYSPSNMKQLQLIARSIGKDVLNELRKTQGLNEYDYPIIRNEDQNIFYKMQSSSMKEISRHNIFQKGHIEVIRFTPNLVKKAIFIGVEENEDGRNPSLKKFFYYGAGLKIGNEVYTSKIVFIENDKGEIFYDESHSTIEKTRLIDIIQKRKKPETFNPQKRQDSFELLENKSHAVYYDKRLINICQVPQMPYLEKVNGKWLPTKEAVEAVKNGKLYIQKNRQEYRMIDNRSSTKIPNPYTFEYDGLTYIPVRSLSEDEKALINNRSPKEYWKNSIIEKPKNGENYSVENFRKKSRGQNADLFYCIERGKFFTPVENGIINLNEGSIDGHFRGELKSFYNNQNTQEVIKNHRPLVFNEKEDVSLMQNIISVLKESEVFYKTNETLGDVRIKFGNIKHGGVSHIIKRRMDKLIKHEGFSYDDAVKETSAILFLSLQNISEAPATKETDGRYAIYKEGIKTSIGKDKNGRYVVTGFDFNDTKQEAADAIKSVNALYGYTPEFLEIYAQVGAAYASLENNVTQQNSPVNSKISDYEKLADSVLIRDITSTKNPNPYTFEYDGLTYIPVRSLSEDEKALINNRSPKEYWKNSIIEKPKNGENYSVENFRKKSRGQNADLFYCIERGKFFTPVENGIINLNEGSIDGHFRGELKSFYNNQNTQEVIKNHRPLVFNEKEDVSLMQNIISVLKESEVFYKTNETLGDVRIKFGNIKHGGVSHIIKRRMDKLIKHEGFSYDDAVKETSAILFLSLQNISEAPATKETDGRYAIYKEGIKTSIGKDKNGRYVVTGFDFNDTKQEAADAIKSVNALYGYTPEFLEIYAQVGAAYASLENNVTQQNSPVNSKISDYEKLLYTSAEIDVNGKIRHCKNGLIKGFENAVSLLDSTFAENSRLKDENSKLKSQIFSVFIHKSNANLNNEIDSLSAEDINLKNIFIRISEKTPFIYQKLGLKELPIYAYRQKLARALFLDKEGYGERRTHGHKDEFSTEEMKRVFENINNPRYIFNSKQNFYDSGKLTLIGIYDEFDKYRNPMMITLCFDKNTAEAQWVTSIYGKNKEVIVNDWTKKGYLLYKNDLEIEKAPEEMVTLYMRISKSSNAYGDKVLLKSQIVNDKISDYEKLLYTSAEIDVNGKIRHCKNGLIKGFENAVSLLDSTFAENSRLKDENSKLKSQIFSVYSECEKLSKDNDELKKQALKNKIRPMGM